MPAATMAFPLGLDGVDPATYATLKTPSAQPFHAIPKHLDSKTLKGGIAVFAMPVKAAPPGMVFFILSCRKGGRETSASLTASCAPRLLPVSCCTHPQATDTLGKRRDCGPYPQVRVGAFYASVCSVPQLLFPVTESPVTVQSHAQWSLGACMHAAWVCVTEQSGGSRTGQWPRCKRF